MTPSRAALEALVVDDGERLLGFDCREVLAVEEAPGGGAAPAYLVRLGRGGTEERCLPCREVVGFLPLSADTVRPLPPVLEERLPPGGRPWAVGIHPRGLFLLY